MAPILLEIAAAMGALAGLIGAAGMLRKASQVIGAQRRFASSVAAQNKGSKLEALRDRLNSANFSDAELEHIIREFEKQLQQLQGSGKDSIDSSLRQPSTQARKEFAAKILEQATAHKTERAGAFTH